VKIQARTLQESLALFTEVLKPQMRDPLRLGEMTGETVDLRPCFRLRSRDGRGKRRLMSRNIRSQHPGNANAASPVRTTPLFVGGRRKPQLNKRLPTILG
jgi:hypothetical protein